jgi:hypothetical protein
LGILKRNDHYTGMARLLLGVKGIFTPYSGLLKGWKDAPEGGEGKPDYYRLAGALIAAGIIGSAFILFYSGKITFEQLTQLIKNAN